ncbi:MAG: ABC transporter substrate-binding protein [Lachnospiraceae bacterium]|nr:ABC transporter substrate-binding protein [Lachnospiraceae bacterium]
MKKRFVLILSAVLACGAMAACGDGGFVGDVPEGSVSADGGPGAGDAVDGIAKEEGSGEAVEDSAYTFTDDLGQKIVVTSHKRVASLLGSYADMWLLAGGSLCAAPEDAFVDFDLALPEDTVNLGETKRLSLELLLSADPDFVLASTNTAQHLEWQPSLSGAGIVTAYFDVACFEDYLRVLKIFTDITGQEGRYKQYGEDLKGQIAEVCSRYVDQTPPGVLYMRASAASIRAKGNDGNVLGEMLGEFGCVNIADTQESLLDDLSVESILLQDPDKILIVQSGDDAEGMKRNVEKMFDENPIWNELSAVKSGEVYFLDKHLYNLKPNARWAEAYEKLAEILYGKMQDAE